MGHWRRLAIALLLVPLLLMGTEGSVFPAESAKRISSEEFLASPFARLFKAGKYPEALKALDVLARRYPDDPLILRYRAATLNRMGRSAEAIALQKKLLSRDPNHVATRLFLGRAYARNREYAKAAEEWRWVIENSESEEYRRWAQGYMNRLRRSGRWRPIRGKRLYLVGKAGLRYDSNPLLKPDDERLASPGDEKPGWNGLIDLTLGYPLKLATDSRVDLLYLSHQTFHDGETDRVDFTSQGVAVDAKKRRSTLRGQSLLLDLRYDFRANFLRDNLFSVMHRLLASADTSLSRRTRTHLYARVGRFDFGPDGRDPDQSSRDGFRGGMGFTQFFYLTADFMRYLFVKQELNLHETRGDDFKRRGYLSRLGLHTPAPLLPKKTDLDISAGFDYGEYPRFTSSSTREPEERRDKRMDFYTALTHYWNPDLATRVSYRFINGSNDNDFYDRKRHIAGVEMIFSI